ncbi:TadE/TadG family type IV pilus assembly protein [Helicobacter sp. 11S02629-2]|uniref:TadE/TadG family type IV pilus assembly protein n=1 Tax=Helicobacter sp. 11S02629-2 TaxID=1476195 RepID=UPI000BA68FD5|nr:TadE/TadG family type IV pilus assembly protein [Helicobacter sp. 11S02629-2]PAF45746.1 hypothetical protein BKH40_02400 [Helicobacter sp. 11S02629-2]
MESKTTFIKDENGVIAVTTAILLPLLFGLMAVGFDLSIDLSKQQRLNDALKEASLVASATKDEALITKATQKLVSLYVGKDTNLGDIKIEYGKQALDPNDLSEIQKAASKTSGGDVSLNPNLFGTYAVVSASMKQQGFLSQFIDKSFSTGTKLAASSKIEKVDNGAIGDYVIIMDYSNAGNKSQVDFDAKTYKLLCEADANLIPVGLCNPPTGVAKYIDAQQTIAASLINTVMGLDELHKSQFAVVPWIVHSQILGRDLPQDVLVGPNEDIYEDGIYLFYPQIQAESKRIRHWNYWSRFTKAPTDDSIMRATMKKIVADKRKMGAPDIKLSQEFVDEPGLMKLLEVPSRDKIPAQVAGEYAKGFSFVNSVASFGLAPTLGSYENRDSIDREKIVESIFDLKEFPLVRMYDPKYDQILQIEGLEANKNKPEDPNLARIREQINNISNTLEALRRVYNRVKTNPALAPGILSQIQSKEAEMKVLQAQIDAKEPEITVRSKGRPMCNFFEFRLRKPDNALCAPYVLNQLIQVEQPLIRLTTPKDIQSIKPIATIPFKIENGGYASDQLQTPAATDSPYGNTLPSGALIRAAQILADSRSGNTKQRIIVFTALSTDVDRYFLATANMCQIIRKGLKQRKGTDVEIYPVNLTKNSQRVGIDEEKRFKEVWEQCTPKENIFVSKDIDSFLKRMKDEIVKDSFGKFTNR